ncbi:MAG: hypothetical protein U9O65_05910 [Thermotogota bacterium]|nr:hypothetical protein [Thermotogota bacterium]
MNLIRNKTKTVVAILILFSIIIFISCSKNKYTISIKDVTVDGTECTFILTTDESNIDDITVLFTVDHEPSTAQDGHLYDKLNFTHTFTEPGTKTVYLTLLKDKKMITESLKYTLKPFHKEKLSHLEYQIENGVLTIDIFPKLENTVYSVDVNGDLYENYAGKFSVPVCKENISIKATAIYNNEVKFEGISLTVPASADEPPEMFIPLPENGYKGKWIPFDVNDDWDKYENLTIKAKIDEIPLLLSDSRLIPEYEIPEGEHTLKASVTDSDGNMKTINKKIKIVKTFEENVPELYIEEGGYFRIASWKNVEPDTEVKIESFKNGNWEEIIKTEDDSPMRISAEFVSENKGDLYRISLASTKTHYLPSVPVFAKSEPLRRLTSTYVISLMGADTLFSAGEDYYLQGRIAVGENKHLRIEPEVTVKIGRGSSLLVNGSIEMDGRRGKISFISLASSDGIRVGSGGVMLARNVDFGNTNIVGDKGSIIILDNCSINGLLDFSGEYLQIYNSNLDDGLIIENYVDSVIYNSEINNGFENKYVKNVLIVNSNIKCNTGTIIFSKMSFYQSTIEIDELSLRNFSTLNLYHSNCMTDLIKINNGSSIYIDTCDFQKGSLSIEKISRAVIPEKLKDILSVKTDDKSTLIFYKIE